MRIETYKNGILISVEEVEEPILSQEDTARKEGREFINWVYFTYNCEYIKDSFYKNGNRITVDELLSIYNNK